MIRYLLAILLLASPSLLWADDGEARARAALALALAMQRPAEPVPQWTWTPRDGTEGRFLDLCHGSHWWGTLDRDSGQFWCPLPESGGRYLRGRVPVAAPEPPPTTYQRYVDPQTFAPPQFFAPQAMGRSC